MKHTVSIVLCLFLSLSLYSNTRPVVQVDPVINLSGEPWLDSVCAAATDSVGLTLGLTGRFRIKTEVQDGSATQSLSVLRQRAEERGFDNIIFGSCSLEDGVYVISMNAFDLSKNQITYSGQVVVESIYDTFDAVDRITYETIDGFSGIHVTYSSLTLIPPETGEPFRFTIDGVSLADGVYRVDKMPSGIHELAVYQERPLGLSEAVYPLEVLEGEVNRYEIPLLRVTDEESFILQRADKEFVLAGLRGKVAAVSEMGELNELLQTPFFQNYRPSLVSKYSQWPMADLVEESSRSNVIQKNNLWSDEEPQYVTVRDFSISTTNATLLMSESDLKKNQLLIPERRTISVDGRAGDWKGVSTFFKDNQGDISRASYLKANGEQGPGQDIYEAAVACDDTRLYFMMRLDSEKYRTDRDYNVNVVGKHLYRLHAGFERQPYFNTAFVRNNNWDKSSWFNGEEVGLKGRWGEVLELSIPYKYFVKSIESYGGIVSVQFHIQRNSRPWHTIDDYKIRIILPSFYYAFRAEVP